MRRIRLDLKMRGGRGDDTFGISVWVGGCGDIVSYSEEGINVKLQDLNDLRLSVWLF